MNDEFFTLILVLFVALVVVVGLAKNTAKAAVKQTKQAPAQPAAPKRPQPARPARQERSSSRLADYKPIQPTLSTAHDHDHAGSLGDLHTEGYDPCHDEQLGAVTDPALAQVRTAPAAATSSLKLSWTGDEMVRGFVMSEILKKKH